MAISFSFIDLAHFFWTNILSTVSLLSQVFYATSQLYRTKGNNSPRTFHSCFSCCVSKLVAAIKMKSCFVIVWTRVKMLLFFSLWQSILEMFFIHKYVKICLTEWYCISHSGVVLVIWRPRAKTRRLLFYTSTPLFRLRLTIQNINNKYIMMYH